MVDASDELIEIGDPEIEPAVPEPTHQVVIQYRDRGVPWMLLPALLMLSAIVTIYAYRKLQPPQQLRPASTPPVAIALVEPKDEPVVPPKAVELVHPPIVEPTPPPVVEPTPIPVVDTTTPTGEPKTAPTVQALGFDPNAFLQPDPRAADPAVNPASQDPPRAEPTPVPAVDPSKLPVEVDPDDLPPDPRKAKQMRASRAVEAKKRVDQERLKFHAELRAILKESGNQAGGAINDLCEQYGLDVDPATKQKALLRLGTTGAYAGASRPVRINLLRNLGYPEAAILVDLYEQSTRFETKKSRSGWRSDDDAIVFAATILANNPPPRPATAPVVAQPNPPASGVRRPGSMLLRDNPGR